MNKIYIEASAGELIDKITILEIKKEKISYKHSFEIIMIGKWMCNAIALIVCIFHNLKCSNSG